MRILLDTHTLIWAVDSPSKLDPQATATLQDLENELFLSAGSIWELAIKIGLQKLAVSIPFRQWMSQAMTDLSLTILPITVEYVNVLTTLPQHHRDLFDRLILAQAMVEKIPVVSDDSDFEAYPVIRIW